MAQLRRPDTAVMVPISQIEIPKNRIRKEFDPLKLKELMESISKSGLLHPIVVRPIQGQQKYELIAGERRLRAIIALGYTEAPCTIFNVYDSIDAKEAELFENLARSNLSWVEEAEGRAQLYELRKRSDPSTRIEDVAKILGESRASTGFKIQLANAMKKDPSLKQTFSALSYPQALRKLRTLEEAKRVQSAIESGRVSISTELKKGDCRELIKEIKDNSIDLILTDPPYGIMNPRESFGPTDNLSPAEVESLYASIIPQLFRVLRPSCSCLIFFDFEQYETLVSACLKAGFAVRRTPIVWDKATAISRNDQGDWPYGYEPILYVWKGKRRFITGLPRDIVIHPSIHSTKRIHPTEKPIDLLKLFISRLTYSGELVLDPFAGSASTLIAASELGRSCIGFEINDANFNLAQKRLSERRATNANSSTA